MTTQPDLTAIHSFLSSYSTKPAVGHMKSALYALYHIHSTYNYAIMFTSDDIEPMHSYIIYPPITDVKVYTDAIPLKLSNTHTIWLTAMHVGVLRLAMRLQKAPFYLSSSSKV
jgi:hypothetical protein